MVYKIIDVDKYQGVINFATERHAGQMYGEYPYTHHLFQVAKYVAQYGKMYLSDHELDVCIHVAFLHDILEDTDTTFEELATVFGEEIAQLVSNLTDPSGYDDRKARKTAGYQLIKKSPISIFVKLCDRLANTRAGGKIDMYRKEFKEFESNLMIKGQLLFLWIDLEDATFNV